MSDPAPAKKLNPARLAAILDASTIALGIAAVSVGVGLYSPRAGLVAFGALLLGAHVVVALLRRR